MLDFIAVIGESARAMSDIFSEDSDRTDQLLQINADQAIHNKLLDCKHIEKIVLVHRTLNE